MEKLLQQNSKTVLTIITDEGVKINIPQKEKHIGFQIVLATGKGQIVYTTIHRLAELLFPDMKEDIDKCIKEGH